MTVCRVCLICKILPLLMISHRAEEYFADIVVAYQQEIKQLYAAGCRMYPKSRFALYLNRSSQTPRQYSIRRPLTRVFLRRFYDIGNGRARNRSRGAS